MQRHAYTRPASPSDQFRDHSDFLRWELAVDERVGPPLRRRRRWPRWSAVMLLVLAGGGWAMVDDKAAVVEWLSSSFTSSLTLAKSLMGESDRTPAKTTELPPLALPPLHLVEPAMLRAAAPGPGAPIHASAESGVTAPSPTDGAGVETLNAIPASETEPDRPAEAEKPAPLPPLPPLTDPLQKKAEAAGLHPELSRALLESLTDTDFKNAAIAIKKAIAETPEDGVLLWPPKPERGLARFRVHFVPGISPACRRYVVGVAKSGWLTTALPMERCGVKPRFARSQAAPKGVPHDTHNP